MDGQNQESSGAAPGDPKPREATPGERGEPSQGGAIPPPGNDDPEHNEGDSPLERMGRALKAERTEREKLDRELKALREQHETAAAELAGFRHEKQLAEVLDAELTARQEARLPEADRTKALPLIQRMAPAGTGEPAIREAVREVLGALGGTEPSPRPSSAPAIREDPLDRGERPGELSMRERALLAQYDPGAYRAYRERAIRGSRLYKKQ